MSNIVELLLNDFSPTQVIVDQADVAPFCRDYKGYNVGSAQAIIFPGSVEDVQRLVSICRAHSIKIIPQGGNTSTNGGAVPDNVGDSIIVNMSRMNRIVDLDLGNNSVTVEAGVVLGDLNRYLAERGRWFPVSFGSEDSCQIGGNVAMNSGGNNVLRYGMMRENVLGVEAVLGNGTVISNLRPLYKKCVGYDLGQLMIGSEGTLGIVTKAVLKLQYAATQTVTAWLACASLDDAVQILGTVRERLSVQLTAFEVISAFQRQVLAKFSEKLKDPIASPYEWAVLVEFRDASPCSQLTEEVEATLEAVLEQGLASDAIVAANLAQRELFWQHREAVLDANKAFGWTVGHDASVPVSRLPEFAAEVGRKLHAAYPDSHFIAAGHAGDGNIHLGVLFEKSAFGSTAEFRKAALEVNSIVFEIADSLGGHFASEHGIGVLHTEAFSRYIPEENVEAMVQIKTALDPDNVMNPGKIFGMPVPMPHGGNCPAGDGLESGARG
ncbi:FAD-binding oxidoreductase [Paracandidimonas soli]|uniref:FAD/FMN-containing dehydrogenase n=1 Tax=Paracandidimonas soli TaxID=1917182 RepID=A0A4R3VF35_9BURK|nr:FAD-binding oxidoreductase [Paracandidimonas soli]TCV02841.1 FAD/FMN-containing dehydrogenase [Paracandidimonas soli]